MTSILFPIRVTSAQGAVTTELNHLTQTVAPAMTTAIQSGRTDSVIKLLSDMKLPENLQAQATLQLGIWLPVDPQKLKATVNFLETLSPTPDVVRSQIWAVEERVSPTDSAESILSRIQAQALKNPSVAGFFKARPIDFSSGKPAAALLNDFLENVGAHARWDDHRYSAYRIIELATEAAPFAMEPETLPNVCAVAGLPIYTARPRNGVNKQDTACQLFPKLFAAAEANPRTNLASLYEYRERLMARALVQLEHDSEVTDYYVKFITAMLTAPKRLLDANKLQRTLAALKDLLIIDDPKSTVPKKEWAAWAISRLSRQDKLSFNHEQIDLLKRSLILVLQLDSSSKVLKKRCAFALRSLENRGAILPSGVSELCALLGDQEVGSQEPKLTLWMS